MYVTFFIDKYIVLSDDPCQREAVWGQVGSDTPQQIVSPGYAYKMKSRICLNSTVQSRVQKNDKQ